VPRVRQAAQGDRAISHLPIHVPLWASLNSDPKLYSRSPAFQTVPQLISLDGNSSCLCQTKYISTITTVERLCTIFGLAEPQSARIELQACPVCRPARHGFIGPDGRELGIFNFNNRILFTHELLDDYTSMYTSSETPFTAWVSTVSRRYAGRSPPHSFVSEQIFRAAWFSYVKLQWFENDMRCPECGPTPNDTIWDGVTLAFSRKHLLPSLLPPTVSHDDSASRQSQYQSNQQILPQSKIRKVIRKVVTGRSLVLSDNELSMSRVATTSAREEQGAAVEEEGRDEEGTMLSFKAVADLLERVKAIPEACEELRKVNADLAVMFSTHCGSEAVLRRHEVPAAYKRFFVQVSGRSIHPTVVSPHNWLRFQRMSRSFK